jgi:hypothetical protein
MEFLSLIKDKDVNYLDIIPGELIGEIIKYLVNISDIISLQKISPNLSDIIISILPYYVSRLIFPTDQFVVLLIMKNKKITVFNLDKLKRSYSELYDFINKNIYEIIHYHNFKYINIDDINANFKLNHQKGAVTNKLRPVNNDFIEFCKEAKFENDLISFLMSSHLINHSLIYKILKRYVQRNNLGVNHRIFLDSLLTKYFEQYLYDPPPNEIGISEYSKYKYKYNNPPQDETNIYAPKYAKLGVALNLSNKISTSNYNNFEIPVWNDEMNSKYNHLINNI